MGLDVSAYERVKLLKACTVAGANDGASRLDERDDVTLLCQSFKAQAEGMADGYYETTGKTHGFRAGSYGGYNRWRGQLAALVGTTAEAVWKDPKPGPFVELINFSDCEGFIGPKTSAKLAADFREWWTRAELNGQPWFVELYRDWQKVFEIAAKGGAVRFG